MEKLTKENINHFKSVISDLIYEHYALKQCYKCRIDIKTSYNKLFETNKIIIVVTYQSYKDSEFNVYTTYQFINKWLTAFDQYYLYNDGSIEHKPLNDTILKTLNIINDNVREFYNNL